MRLPSYLVRSSTGVFHFRWIVPLPWRERLGRKVIKRSLGTTDVKIAQIYALTLSARYAVATKGNGMTKSLDELLESAESTRRRNEYEIKPGRYGYSVKSDGAEDHKNAMEAIKALTPVSANDKVSMTPVTKRVALSVAIEEWLKVVKVKNPKAKTQGAKKKAVDGFHDWKKSQTNKSKKNTVSRVGVADLTGNDCNAWLMHLQAIQTPKPLSLRTLQNKFIYLAGFFDWAVKAGYYPKGDNPARGHVQVTKKHKRQRAKTHGWQPFDVEQLKAIYQPSSLKQLKDEASRWLPVIALYTGARSNEIALLELEDFLIVDGLPCFGFTLEGEDKSFKTEESQRTTPIHPELIALGLMERVERLRKSKETKLFPHLSFDAQNGPAGRCGTAFSRLLSNLQIEARGNARVGLHSYRDTVIRTLSRAKVPKEIRHDYVGHEQTTMGDHRDAYGEQTPPDILAAECHQYLNWVKVKVIDLKAVKPLLK